MSTFLGFLLFSFFFFSMIKCRQGGAARLKFIIALGCMSVEWESEGGLQRKKGERRREG